METGPRKYAERGMFREVWKAINALIEQQRRIAPMSGENVKVNRTVNGAVISANIPEPEEAQPVQWKGEWRTGIAYVENDIVIRGSANLSSAAWNDTDSILTDGTKAGVYIALQDVPAGTAAPLEPNTGAYWETLARFATHIFTVKKTGSADISGVPQSILMDATSPAGAVRIRLQDCNTKILTIREVEVCVGGQTRHMMVLGSAPY